MGAGLIEFLNRLISPIESSQARIYHWRTGTGQMIGMAILAIFCYQFTVVGDGVYADAVRSFIFNPVLIAKLHNSRWIDIYELNVLAQALKGSQDLWDVSRWFGLILKVLFMSCVIAAYALARQRTLYWKSVVTAVFHVMAYMQIVIGIVSLCLGFMLGVAGSPLIVLILLGLFLLGLCLLITILLFVVIGRIIGSSIDGDNLEGLLVMGAAMVLLFSVQLIGIIID